MAAVNWPTSLAFGWKPGYDDPGDGYHVTPGDPGGGTFAGVIEATWQQAVADKLVTGDLRNATRDQLATVLRVDFWGSVCDALPTGIDLLFYNGRMMSGGYPKLFQAALGVKQDGFVGPITIAAAGRAKPGDLAVSLTVAHIFYLSQLGEEWTTDHGGWTKRLLDAHVIALHMISST